MRRVYAFCVVVCVFSQISPAFAKDGKEGPALNSSNNNDAIKTTPAPEFHWNEHNKLSWEDFRGPVRADNDESAAATHCGIGFKVQQSVTGNKPAIMVYNTFYTNKSWVRSDARTCSILNHEQGHFDLCEIYTRKLKNRMNGFDFGAADIKSALMAIYTEVSNEYESRQQAYEYETAHGTNVKQQKKWVEMISNELN